jgi:hypothetical protein
MVEGEWWMKILVLTFINFFVFIMAGMVYCVPIDLTWEIIGKGPSILLGASCLWMYCMFFAALLVQGVSTCPKCKEEKDE